MLKVGLSGRGAMHAMLSDRLHVTAALSARPTIRRRSSRFGDQAEHLRTWRRGNGYDALVLPGADTSVEHPKNRKSTWVIGSRRSAHRVGVTLSPASVGHLITDAGLRVTPPR